MMMFQELQDCQFEDPKKTDTDSQFGKNTRRILMLHVDRFNKDTEDLLQRSAILTSVKPSFNVTPTLLHGLATFATKNIMAGDIITQEKPIVSTRSVKNEQHALLCDCCHCPIEHLRQQLLHCLSNSTATKNDSQISKLPFPALGYEPGPSYTQSSSACCNQKFCPVVWCATCSTAAQPEHLLLCKQATVENHTFHEHSIHTDPAYLLAAVVLVKSLVALHTSNVNAANFLQLGCWWKEYNHPLWEELDIPQTLNETKQERKKDCQEAHFLLVQALTISVTKIYGSTSPLLPWMKHNITLETYSQIMGMLSCNVMEIDFPSPVREYFFTLPEHQEIQTRAKSLEELNNNNNNNNSKKRKRNISEQDKEWKSIQLLNKSIDDLISSTPNCVGQGLYPVLSLSNHSCDPNASIEFLNENNTGSMVALRNIQKGEEITITYVPNGEDTNFNPDRFRHFKPTRTWKYFDNMVEEISSDEDEEEERVEDEKDEMGMNGNEKKGGEEDKEAVGDEEVVGDEEGEEEEEEEGTSWQERRDALLSYGFVCRCSRCVVESAQEK